MEAWTYEQHLGRMYENGVFSHVKAFVKENGSKSETVRKIYTVKHRLIGVLGGGSIIFLAPNDQIEITKSQGDNAHPVGTAFIKVSLPTTDPMRETRTTFKRVISLHPMM